MQATSYIRIHHSIQYVLSTAGIRSSVEKYIEVVWLTHKLPRATIVAPYFVYSVWDIK